MSEWPHRFMYWLGEGQNAAAIQTITAVVIGIFTVVLGGITAWYAREMKKQNQLAKRTFLISTAPRLNISFKILKPEENQVEWRVENCATGSGGDVVVRRVTLRWRTQDGEQCLEELTRETILAAGQSIAGIHGIAAPHWHPVMSEWFHEQVKTIFVVTVYCSDILGYVDYECSWGWRTGYRTRVLRDSDSPSVEAVVLPSVPGLTHPSGQLEKES